MPRVTPFGCELVVIVTIVVNPEIDLELRIQCVIYLGLKGQYEMLHAAIRDGEWM
jgi:hypothetical protein